MKIHWWILIALVGGVLIGGWMATGLDAEPWVALSFGGWESR